MGRAYTSSPKTAETVDNPLEGIGFELDGQSFECHGRLSVLDASELASAAVEDAMGEVSEAGMASIARFFQAALGPAEYRRFRNHVRAKDTSDEVVLEILQGIRDDFEVNAAKAAGRPTRQSPGSSPGPQDRAERLSRVISLQQGTVQVVGEERPPANRAGRRTAAAKARKAPGKAATG